MSSATRGLAPIPALTLFGLLAPPLAVVFAIWWHALHGVPVRGFDLALLAAFYCISLIGIEVGYHRCFSHRAFEVSAAGARLLVAMGATAFQGALFWWVATHRRHHARTDREGDPHSPNLHDGTPRSRIKAVLWAHSLWVLLQHDRRAASANIPPVFDLLKRREIWLMDHYYEWIALAALLLPGLLGLVYEPSLQSFVSAFLWGGLIRVFAATNAFMLLNSMGHLFGTRPHRNGDGSRNNGLLALLTFGQGWHNNHHAYPRSACLQLRPWQFDPGYAVIKLLIWLRLAHSPKRVRDPAPAAIRAN